MPFVLCEYVHAMGNGPGGMTEYQELFDRYPRLMGGFVWEWLEHGITVTDDDGREHFAYGGDFGEEIHDGNFVTDGLVDADRKPRPGLLDFKKVIEPLRHHRRGGLVRLHRRQRASTSRTRPPSGSATPWRPTAALSTAVRWRLRRWRPAANPPLQLPAGLAALAGDAAAVLTVRAELAEETDWADAGHEVAWGQALLNPPEAARVHGHLRP